MDRKSLFIIGIILVLNLLPQLYLWDHISDDAFISFRYAERMLEGKGLTFNDGEPVEGFSNPLWIFLIAIFSKIASIDIPTSARILGLILSSFVYFFVYLIAITLFEKKKSTIFFVFISVILLFTPGFHVYSTAGLEGPLLSFLLISTVYFSIRKNKYHIVITSLLMGLVGICRPEGLLYSFLWFLFSFELNHFDIKIQVKRISLILLPNIIYFAFRLSYYGELLPNTAFAKPSGTYSSLIGFLENFNYLIIISFPLTTLLFYNYVKNDRSQNIFLRSIAGLLLANLIFLFYAGGDWMLFSRFFLPIWPILLLGFTYLLISFLYSIAENQYSFTIISYVCLLGLVITEVLLFQEQWFEYNSNSNYANLMKGKDQVIVGEWLNKNIKKNSTVATFRIGGISYGAPNLFFYDTFGLTDKEISKFRSANKINYDVKENPIIKRYPDLLAIINLGGYRMITVEPVKGLDMLLGTNYSLIKTFKQGNGVFFEIWINKDKRGKILL